MAHGQSIYRGEYSTQSPNQGTPPLLLISFTPLAQCASLDSGKAIIALNRLVYLNVPLSTVNISPLLSSCMKNRLEVWGNGIPTMVQVHVIEVAKVLEAELLRSLDESAPYCIGREDTKELVAAFFADADETIVENLQVSLICPIAKRRIRVPCRGVACKHVQCFDAYAYLDLNESTLYPLWCCPICNNVVLLDDISVDLLMLDIVREADEQCTAVKVLNDGSWEPAADYDDHSIITIEDSPFKGIRKSLRDVSLIDLTVDSD
ncbi:hypothetical protein HPB52_019857 [Rhipicephalus sanguineus]|uniref:SP-RING-type domain-containing protein n=2 Tax=Rhipicephalus sanguineus TaxID=34632 RepID=A0A9D4PCD5_RHISA|nr:hypothetical protein HPB52_019857 [Rhipicephalus sanguineus]